MYSRDIATWNRSSQFVYENQLLNFIIKYHPLDSSQPAPEINVQYRMGAFGDFYMDGEGDATSEPGKTFWIDVVRQTYDVSGSVELLEGQGDFPFSVTWELLQTEYSFADYFEVTGPDMTEAYWGRYTIKVKEDAIVPENLSIKTTAKLDTNLFSWIQQKIFVTSVACIRYLNFFTTDPNY